MTRPMKLTIGYLYPDIMSLYGDRGNVLCLSNRCRWRGITVEIKELRLGEPVNPQEIDIFFIGGGADSHQRLIADDLLRVKGPGIREAIEEGAAALCVCGGYQLLGHYYRPISGEDLPGLGLFDAWTIHRGAELGVSVNTITEAKVIRGVGNLIVEWKRPDSQSGPSLLVGFENHGGRTYLGPTGRPLGKVLLGRGNNGQDGFEGAIYKHAIGTYIHGPCLPKNPHLADYLIQAALLRRYGPVELLPLEDDLELQAHRAALEHVRRIRGEEILTTHHR
jgi:CobQ-like glutamine amidotransferase family enzyme